MPALTNRGSQRKSINPQQYRKTYKITKFDPKEHETKIKKYCSVSPDDFLFDIGLADVSL